MAESLGTGMHSDPLGWPPLGHSETLVQVEAERAGARLLGKKSEGFHAAHDCFGDTGCRQEWSRVLGVSLGACDPASPGLLPL